MASGRGSNFEALVVACRDGRLAAEVVLLAVNTPNCLARRRAERLAIPCACLDHRGCSDRRVLDVDLISLFRRQRVDLVVMVGWMRIVTPQPSGRIPGQASQHSSLPSACFPWPRGPDAAGQDLRAGVRVQAAVPVLADESQEDMAARIRTQEHRILPLGVQLAAERL